MYQLSTVQHHISEYQLYLQQSNPQEPAVTAIINALPLLNTLQTAAQTTAPGFSPGENRKPLFQSFSGTPPLRFIIKPCKTLSCRRLEANLKKYLETAANDKNPEQLYVALKAYLMLRQPELNTDKPKTADSQKWASDFIIHTLEQISPAFSKTSQNNLLAQTNFAQHLQNALPLRQGNTLNNNLIKETRKTLNHLTDTELAYILVKNMTNNNQESALNFGTNIGTPHQP